ncbi:hypothetical protein M407DRAFT_28299 [Tulasnella calospora MUT 4182]|uniref:Uncharacterized protein n=1 Tax=Tulasnella calospora MUT 4182 TaxID=1051891 RepID=A0A0C3LLB0_9AGAM|nr:hypothetical protein M407DRAFT_28299 [Tulasnella calospora MUT 4182]
MSMSNPRTLRRREPFSVPKITDPIFQKSSGVKDMIWFIAATLQLAARPVTTQAICASINEHQPWRIEVCRGINKRVAAQRNIQWILSRSPAFEHDSSGHWYMTGRPLVRTPDMLPVSSTAAVRAMTVAEIQACLQWANHLFSAFENLPSSRREGNPSEASFAESAQPDGDANCRDDTSSLPNGFSH